MGVFSNIGFESVAFGGLSRPTPLMNLGGSSAVLQNNVLDDDPLPSEDITVLAFKARNPASWSTAFSDWEGDLGKETENSGDTAHVEAFIKKFRETLDRNKECVDIALDIQDLLGRLAALDATMGAYLAAGNFEAALRVAPYQKQLEQEYLSLVIACKNAGCPGCPEMPP